MSGSIMIFTDGAASGNPGPGGWAAVVATPDGHVRELGGGEAHTTNNRMEMTAAIEALRFVRDHSAPVTIHTDSTYLIKGISGWISGWRRRGWKTSAGEPVKNRELWEALDELTRARPSSARVTWSHVRGHVGVPGNERVDAIAVAFTRGESPDLYDGARSRYGIDLDAAPRPASPTASSRSPTTRARRGKAYSYLSHVGGVLRRHRTWAECERRVKGQSGARFKKATSAADEVDICRAWGVDPIRLRDVP